MTELMQASREWATRPDDQRFLSLEDMREFKRGFLPRERGGTTITVEMPYRDMRIGQDGTDLFLLSKGDRPINLSPIAFEQVCKAAEVPYDFLPTLKTETAQTVLMEKLAQVTPYTNGTPRLGALFMSPGNGAPGKIHSVNGPRFPRIFDFDIIELVIEMNERAGGAWKIPYATYQDADPKRATTLYASDRDHFLFLVDEERHFDIAGHPMKVGFFLSGSEMGVRKERLVGFQYDKVCDNRIVWNARGVFEIEIAHTGDAVDRWLREAQPGLQRFIDSDPRETIRRIEAARDITPKQLPMGPVDDTAESVTEFLRSVRVKATVAEAEGAMAYLKQGRAADGLVSDEPSLYNLVQAGTAWARDNLGNSDKRVPAERKFGQILNFVPQDAGRKVFALGSGEEMPA
jgi:hypothetical protein